MVFCRNLHIQDKIKCSQFSDSHCNGRYLFLCVFSNIPSQLVTAKLGFTLKRYLSSLSIFFSYSKSDIAFLILLFITVLRNGDVKQQNLTTLEVDRIKRSSSLTPSSEQEDEEEGQVTPLPGSTVDIDVLSWPPDEDGQVHVTVIPSGQVSVLL